MIHKLGIDSVPVDESSNSVPGVPPKSPVEMLPSTALALVRGFSTRLFLTLILASTSSIRRHMLDAAGVEYEAVKPDVDEEGLKLGLTGGTEIALRLAEAKALSV